MMTDLTLTLVAAVLTSAGCIRLTLFSGSKPRRMYWRTKARMHPGPGFARHAEITAHFGRTATWWHGRRARPDLSTWERLRSPACAYSVRIGRGPLGRRIYTRAEDQVAVIAPPRMLKSYMLADRIHSHPGALVCSTTRQDLYKLTSGRRARLGPVSVFNPEGIGGIPSTFRMDIVADCREPDEALRTASALIGPINQENENGMWQSMASAALAGLLHAAAIRRLDMSAVWHWVNRLDDQQVRETLALPGASANLLAPAIALQQDNRTQNSVRSIVAEALTWVASPDLLRMVSGSGLTRFDAAQWLAARGSIYIITMGEGSTFLPLYRAVTEKIYRECRLAGSLTRHERIACPVLFALDEVTQTAAVPLNEWLATAAGDGIQIAYVVHTPAQLVVRYGEPAAKAIWQLASVKIILPGSSDTDLAGDLAKLCGQTDDERPEPVATADFIRRLPRRRALVIARNHNPIVVTVRPIFKRITHRKALRPVMYRLGLWHPPYVQPAPLIPLPMPEKEKGQEAA